MFLGQFVLMYLVFDAILYRKKAGLIYRVTRSCSTKGTLIENLFVYSICCYIYHGHTAKGRKKSFNNNSRLRSVFSSLSNQLFHSVENDLSN